MSASSRSRGFGSRRTPLRETRLVRFLVRVLVVVGIVAIVVFVLGPKPTPTGVRVGEQAPPLVGTSLDGRPISLADLRGRPVLVNFWASWCVPCQDEFPLFKEAAARHPGLRVLGVVFQDSASSALAFAVAKGADWPSMTDPDGSLAKSYQVVAPPQSYFIDPNGVVRSRQIGQLTSDDFERQVTAIGG
jgi:cytochrome c biogenesis protein CcmG, thiol:disulfide interchange protein DsbE